MKNQLQAELCSTLKRRQNGQHKKPNFVIPKNSTINAIYNQLKVLDAVEKAMASEGESSSEKPTNGSPSNGSPLPERATTLARPKTNTPADTEKPKLMISHGRPNFVRPEPVFKIATAVPPQPIISPEPTQPISSVGVKSTEDVKNVQLKSNISVEPTLPNTDIEVSTPQPIATKTIQASQQFNGFTAHNKTTASNGLNFVEALQVTNINKSSENEETTKYTNGANTLKTSGAHYSNSTVKSFTKLSHSTPTSGRSSPVLSSPLPPRKVPTIGYKQQDAMTSQSGSNTLKTSQKILISESSTSSTSSITSSACAEQNEIQRKLQSLKTVDMHEVSRHTESSAAPTRRWTAKKVYGSQSPPLAMTTAAAASPLSPRKAQPFKVHTQPQSPHITSPAIHHLAQNGSPNFDVKPIVSFSKDLCVTNRYPDKVKVFRSTSSSSEAASVSTKATSTDSSTSETNTYFSDLKFIINENGEVIHSSVTQQCH